MRAAVAAIVEDERDEVVSVYIYHWTISAFGRKLPAGGVEDEELVIEAAKREAFE